MGRSQPRPRPTSEAKIGFKRKGMVHWLAPWFLIRAGHEVDESGRFARYTDKREVEAGLPTALYEPRDVETSDAVLPPYDDASYRDENGDLWIDFASDVAEGFSPTYTVAWLLSRPRLKLTHGEATYETKRGRILVLGGDQVYPSAKWGRYRDRFVGPYTAALPWVEEEGKAPHLFAIPGNHDWYDGLTSFMRVFCAGAWIGGWRTRQRRSYFAFRLSDRWWLWATDIQFDTYLDSPQLDYFREAALEPGDRVILVTAKPSWVGADARKTELMATGSRETLSYVEEELIASRGAKVAVTLTGDKHHYSRYAAAGGQLPEQRITAGGGGAHTSATHGLPPTVPLHGSEKARYDLVEDVVSPTAEESKRLRNRIVRQVLSVGTIGMGVFIAGLYLLIAFLMDVQVIAGIAVSVALAGGLVVFAKAKQPAGWLEALALGIPHAAAHVGAVLLLRLVDFPLLPLLWILVLGYPIGLTIFVLYLLLANLTEANQHATEIFGGLASTEYKNFLRLRLKSDGSLTIYPVGIKRPPKWVFRREGARDSPWFGAHGYNEEDPEARLLEPPIPLSKPPPAASG